MLGTLIKIVAGVILGAVLVKECRIVDDIYAVGRDKLKGAFHETESDEAETAELGPQTPEGENLTTDS